MNTAKIHVEQEALLRQTSSNPWFLFNQRRGTRSTPTTGMPGHAWLLERHVGSAKRLQHPFSGYSVHFFFRAFPLPGHSFLFYFFFRVLFLFSGPLLPFVRVLPFFQGLYFPSSGSYPFFLDMWLSTDVQACHTRQVPLLGFAPCASIFNDHSSSRRIGACSGV